AWPALVPGLGDLRPRPLVSASPSAALAPDAPMLGGRRLRQRHAKIRLFPLPKHPAVNLPYLACFHFPSEEAEHPGPRPLAHGGYPFLGIRQVLKDGPKGRDDGFPGAERHAEAGLVTDELAWTAVVHDDGHQAE